MSPDPLRASAVGLVDQRAAGRVRLGGRDAVPFLHALVTNDVASLAVGEGCYAAYLTPQGRLITDMHVYRRPDDLLLVLPSGLGAAMAARLDELLFAEDVKIADVSTAMAQVGVVGAAASAVVAGALGLAEAALAGLPLNGHLLAGDLIVARTDRAVVPSFDLFAPAGRWGDATDRLVAAGAHWWSEEDAEAHRIEAGRPRFGVDMTTETIPLEAGLLDRAISTSKGCYVGQEVIVRVLHRGGGRVARRLVTLAFNDDGRTPPAAGTVLTADGHETGRITSAALSPSTGRAIALGYVHRDAAEVGREVDAAGAAATITGFAG